MTAGARWRQLRQHPFDHLDLLVVAFLAVAALLAVAFDAGVIIRLALAVPLVVALPGYAFVEAIFPSRELPAVERLLLSLGASIVLAVMAGLLLAASGALDPLRWASALAGLTLIGAATAWLRRIRRGSVGPRPTPASMPRLGALMVVVAMLISADVVAGSRLFAAQNEPAAPLQLWMVPAAETRTDAILGVHGGPAAGDYRVVISTGGEAVYEFEIELAAQETWQRQLSFTPELRARPIVARLYEGGSRSELRYVVLQPETDGG